VSHLIETSYNRPKLSSSACWNPDGITFVDKTVAYSPAYSLFVDRNNTVYTIDSSSKLIFEWSNSSTILPTTIDHEFFSAFNLFITPDGNIYVSGALLEVVEKWRLNTTVSIVEMDVSGLCYGLFVDVANFLYCSLPDMHQVVKQSLNDDASALITVAGNGSYGLVSTLLHQPLGIFVDTNTNFDLYVADCRNDRVQLFGNEQLDGTTVAGNGALSSMTLDCPSAVFLDADANLFIVDSGNNRIVRSTHNGFYCLVGCSRIPSAAPDRLGGPFNAAFDTTGNLIVVDSNNFRIQKFILIANPYGK
jgi:hypothetical protein